MHLASGMGKRLREERERMSLKQEEFAKRLGVSRRTQIAYEAEESSPTVTYLQALQDNACDVAYVVTGQREPQLLTHAESTIVGMFRALTPDKQDVVLATMRVMQPVMSGNGTKTGKLD